MTKQEHLQALINLQYEAELLPKIAGRSAVLKKIDGAVTWMETFKADAPTNIPALFLKECREAVDELSARAEAIEKEKEKVKEEEIERGRGGFRFER